MKRQKSCLVHVLALAAWTLSTLCTFAATKTVDGITWTYTVSDGKATLGKGTYWYDTAIPTSTSGTISIPSSLGGYPVTSIGRYAFYYCDELTAVTIPSSVTSIGIEAFECCHKLTSVMIPSSVTNIANSAFADCRALTSLTIPSSVTDIGERAFYECKGLTSLTIPSSVTNIGEWAFSECDGLTSVTLSPNVTSIGSYVFNGCYKLASISIPEGVTSIGDSAFSSCGGLTNVTLSASLKNIIPRAFSNCRGMLEFVVAAGNQKYKSVDGLLLSKNGRELIAGVNGDVSIPNGVTRINDYAFSQRVGLTSITIPTSVTSIGTAAFIGCRGLTSVTIPSGIKEIRPSAFSYCSELTSVTIPSGVQRIFNSAFRGCRKLTHVTIPSSVTSIGNTVFADCPELMDIFVDGENQTYSSCNGLLLSKDGATLIAGVNGDVDIPDCVTSVGSSAFYGCSKLTNVSIPSCVTNISDCAFQSCTKLTHVTIPFNVTSISNSAFNGCSKLTALFFEGNAPKIGTSAFAYCANGCTAYVREGSTGWNVDIPGTWNDIKIDYRKPDGGPYYETVNGFGWTFIVSDGKASVGTDYSTAIGPLATGAVTIPSMLGGCPVTCIGNYAFSKCSGLTSVTIPSCVTNVGYAAFSDCGGLNEFVVDAENLNYKSVDGLLLSKDGRRLIAGINGDVVLPSGVMSIDAGAFSDRKGLTTVTIPSGVVVISSRAFYGCSGLTSVMIPSSVTAIASLAFEGCSGMTSITIHPGVTLIGYRAFSCCRGLTSVTIPSKVTNIGPEAFSSCSELTCVSMPSSVTSIGASAFLSCSKLKNVCFDGNAPTVDSSAFTHCAAGCTAYVAKDSTGWGVDIPGTWNGINIAYYTAYDVEGAGEVKIHDDWVEKYAPGKSEAEVTELLAQTAANGTYKNWECYVLGLDPTNEESKIVARAPQSQDSDKIDVGFNMNVPAGCGYNVNYSYVKDGEEIACGNSGVSIDLTGDGDPSGLYTIKVKLVPDGSSTSTSEIEVEQTVGVRKSTSELTKTAIAVPWGELTGEGAQSICVSNLVKTANLTVGDKLHVYDTANRAYETWQLSANKTWEPLATYVVLADGSVSTVSAGAPTTTTIARGSAVWLERQDTSKPFYLYGEYQAGTIETAIAGGTTATPVWNFVAPPTLGDFDLNAITGASEDDKIVVTTANGPKVYTYKDGAWGSDANTTVTRTLPGGGTIEVVKKTRDTSNTTIAAGTGFMYVSQGGAPTIQW